MEASGTHVRVDSTAWRSSDCSIPRDWPAEECTGARNSANKLTEQTYSVLRLADRRTEGWEEKGTLQPEGVPAGERCGLPGVCL